MGEYILMTSENNRKSFRQQVESGIGQHKRAISSEKVKKAEEERKERALDLEVPRLIGLAAEILEEKGVATKPLIECEEYSKISRGYDKPCDYTYLANRRVGEGWVLKIYIDESTKDEDISVTRRNGLELFIDKSRKYTFCKKPLTKIVAPLQSKGFFKPKPVELESWNNNRIIWDHQLLQTMPGDELLLSGPVRFEGDDIKLSTKPAKKHKASSSSEPYLWVANPPAAEGEVIYLSWWTNERDPSHMDIPFERALAMAVGRRIHEEQKSS